jgi:hypothetical protein
MAVAGASSESFMALVFLGAGGFVLLMGVRYSKDPTYTDAEGNEQKAGPPMLAFLFGIGALLVAGGAFVMIHGLH